MSLKRVARALIRWYQRYLSAVMRPRCRFLPTCSEYALEAIEHRGPWRGGLLAVWRLLRCQPWGQAGYDPVPPAPLPRRSGREP